MPYCLKQFSLLNDAGYLWGTGWIGYSDNVVKIDKEDNVYLNGNQIVINYKNSQSESENVISPRLTTRYHESDSGDPSLYTVLGKTERVANIYFESAIGGLTTTVILGVLSTIVPGLSFTTGVAAALGTVYAAYNTKGISCVIRHYYKEGWQNGWYMGSFAEKIVTTWYSGLNYTGNRTITTHYRTGYLY